MGRNNNNPNSKKKIERRRIIQNKFNFKSKKLDKIELINNSKIQFNKTGWRVKLGKLLNITPQRAGKLLKELKPDIWEICFKHNDRN